MCKAKDYSQQLLDIYNNISSDVHRLKEEVSTANLFNIDMLHVIENTNFNACEGYMLAKQIKENQIFRRQSKYELETLIQLKNYIDKNTATLNQVHQEIINTDNLYKSNIENKVYNPKVMGIKAPEPMINNHIVVHSAAHSKPKQKQKNISTSISSIPLQIDVATESIGKATYKKSGEKIHILNKLDENHYLVKRVNGKKEVFCSKHIINLVLDQDCLLSAK